MAEPIQKLASKNEPPCDREIFDFAVRDGQTPFGKVLRVGGVEQLSGRQLASYIEVPDVE